MVQSTSHLVSRVAVGNRLFGVVQEPPFSPMGTGARPSRGHLDHDLRPGARLSMLPPVSPAASSHRGGASAGGMGGMGGMGGDGDGDDVVGEGDGSGGGDGGSGVGAQGFSGPGSGGSEGSATNDFNITPGATLFYGSKVALQVAGSGNSDNFRDALFLCVDHKSGACVLRTDADRQLLGDEGGTIVFTLVDMLDPPSMRPVKSGGSVWLCAATGSGEPTWRNGSVVAARVGAAMDLSTVGQMPNSKIRNPDTQTAGRQVGVGMAIPAIVLPRNASGQVVDGNNILLSSGEETDTGETKQYSHRDPKFEDMMRQRNVLPSAIGRWEISKGGTPSTQSYAKPGSKPDLIGNFDSVGLTQSFFFLAQATRGAKKKHSDVGVAVSPAMQRRARRKFGLAVPSSPMPSNGHMTPAIILEQLPVKSATGGAQQGDGEADTSTGSGANRSSGGDEARGGGNGEQPRASLSIPRNGLWRLVMVNAEPTVSRSVTSSDDQRAERTLYMARQQIKQSTMGRRGEHAYPGQHSGVVIRRGQNFSRLLRRSRQTSDTRRNDVIVRRDLEKQHDLTSFYRDRFNETNPPLSGSASSPSLASSSRVLGSTRPNTIGSPEARIASSAQRSRKMAAQRTNSVPILPPPGSHDLRRDDNSQDGYGGEELRSMGDGKRNSFVELVNESERVKGFIQYEHKAARQRGELFPRATPEHIADLQRRDRDNFFGLDQSSFDVETGTATFASRAGDAGEGGGGGLPSSPCDSSVMGMDEAQHAVAVIADQNEHMRRGIEFNRRKQAAKTMTEWMDERVPGIANLRYDSAVGALGLNTLGVEREIGDFICLAFHEFVDRKSTTQSELEMRMNATKTAYNSSGIRGMLHLDPSTGELIHVWEGARHAILRAEGVLLDQVEGKERDLTVLMRCKTTRRSLDGWNCGRGPRHTFLARIRQMLT